MMKTVSKTNVRKPTEGKRRIRSKWYTSKKKHERVAMKHK
jgi:hypothetical protein